MPASNRGLGHRIDSHQHFWMLERGDYHWLRPSQTALYRDFLPEHLEPLLAQAGIQRTILVQAAPTVAETRFLLRLAERHDFVAGVVGWMDMEGGAAGLVEFETLLENSWLAGIRPMIQDIADPDWMLKPALQPAFEAVIAAGLGFDALVTVAHLPRLLRLLERHPELRTVIDHGAKPDIAAGEWQPWADWIARIAAETSACCKLSGLITEVGTAQTFDDLTPYMDHLLECFGSERLMWGSDWPVLNLRHGYGEWAAATQRWLDPLSGAQREAIEGGTAACFYRLHVMPS